MPLGAPAGPPRFVRTKVENMYDPQVLPYVVFLSHIFHTTQTSLYISPCHCLRWRFFSSCHTSVPTVKCFDFAIKFSFSFCCFSHNTQGCEEEESKKFPYAHPYERPDYSYKGTYMGKDVTMEGTGRGTGGD